LKGNDKVLVLGAMAELGEGSVSEHEQIVALVKKNNWKEVLLVGGDFLKINHPFRSFENASDVKKWLDEKKFEHTHFLVKGSRSMQMEKAITG
jgi:UDP-N-acetylmuramoyl-tripeptide--D-alanyl-D-alanine ligase